MMAATRHTLLSRMPPLRGRLTEQADLATGTWFRVGGAAELLFRPADVDDLADFLRLRPEGVAVTVLGVGSNLLIRDGGISGVTIRLRRGFTDISIAREGAEARVTVGAAALDASVAQAAAAAGLTGLEFLSGVPGTIGGALRMNAGAFGREMIDVVVTATALDSAGTRHILSPVDLGFSYRHSSFPDDWVFVAAELRATEGAADDIAAAMAEIADARAESQPIRARTGGSTFKNPPGAKAWKLIDAAGCRGLKRGGAQVSEKHCNFLINAGDATAADLEALGEEVRRRVKEESGVTLNWEIRRIGHHAAPAAEVTTNESRNHD
ncbi:MAG: UDP-N-acetylmuramate dehydrogenase [Alphaproteobacteria bacterium]|nr:UDP-N-acetylmuramate dehydrogenase [Alphaproteobacteria bacterium]